MSIFQESPCSQNAIAVAFSALNKVSLSCQNGTALPFSTWKSSGQNVHACTFSIKALIELSRAPDPEATQEEASEHETLTANQTLNSPVFPRVSVTYCDYPTRLMGVSGVTWRGRWPLVLTK